MYIVRFDLVQHPPKIFLETSTLLPLVYAVEIVVVAVVVLNAVWT